jgi:hypothetical protein
MKGFRILTIGQPHKDTEYTEEFRVFSALFREFRVFRVLYAFSFNLTADSYIRDMGCPAAIASQST